MASRFFSDLLQTVAEHGRSILRKNIYSVAQVSLSEQCDRLLSGRGEASLVALAGDILARWHLLNDAERREFLLELSHRFGVDSAKIDSAIASYRAAPSDLAIQQIHRATEARRQELLRRLNFAPEGVRTLVHIREGLIDLLKDDPSLSAADTDFRLMFTSWFNRGFLVLRQLDWTTPANILEKIIKYEAVHAIRDWSDLRRRLAPRDRRLYAFFHPRLADEPLIFVAVALTNSIPERISEVLAEQRDSIAAYEGNTAVFYSISNCQKGLRGVSFGNFLIKQVVEELRNELPAIKTFVTLSPAPGFAGWLTAERRRGASGLIGQEDAAVLALLENANWPEEASQHEKIRPLLLRLAAYYFLKAKNEHGQPADPVARFHLGNGARLEKINFLGDSSHRGLKQSYGLMVNYLYELNSIEENHEDFVRCGRVVAAPHLLKLLNSEHRVAVTAMGD